MDKPPFSAKHDGLPDDLVQSLYQDDPGASGRSRVMGWPSSTTADLYAVTGVPSTEVYSITGDKAGNLWLSGNQGLSHLRDGHLVETFSLVSAGTPSTGQGDSFDPDRGGIWLHSGRMAVSSISRMVRSARRTPPLMGWVRAMLPAFGSIAMGPCGPQPEGGR